MDFRRKTKRLSGLPIAFYVVVLLFFVLLFSFNSSYYKNSEIPQPVVVETPQAIEEPIQDTLTKPEIYVPEAEVLPPVATIDDDKNQELKEKDKDKQAAETSKKEKVADSKTKQKEEEKKPIDPKSDKVTKIGKDRPLTAFIPGTMGKAGKLPKHNCKTKGQLVMFFTVDKSGNVTSTGRSSGIKDGCNITAAVIWMKQYVKAKKSQSNSQGTYTINFN